MNEEKDDIQYISKVEIKGLWERYDLEWKLNPDVNILSGINGSGKTTILDCISSMMIGLFPENTPVQECKLSFDEKNYFQIKYKEGKFMNYEFFRKGGHGFGLYNLNTISTFDTELREKNIKLDKDVRTELDRQIYFLQKRYLDYTINMNKTIILYLEKRNKKIQTPAPQEVIYNIKKRYNRFLEIIDLLFKETDKKVDRDKNEVWFLSGDKEISPYQLSSGEKQILVILLTVLVQDNKPSILFMDEPEISLHIDWQRKLIEYIRELNPNVQIILATHSPGLIIEGWADRVFDVRDLITKDYLKN